MSNFYEIIKKLKTSNPQKSNLQGKKLKIKLLFFLIITFVSGIGITLFSYYIKSFVKKSTEKSTLNKPISNLVQNYTQTVHNQTNSSSPSPSLSKKIPEKTLSSPLKIKTKLSYPAISPSKLPQTSSQPQVIEGFLLTQGDLLNNLLVLAEEERKKGNYQMAIVYYENYLKEKEDPLVMNNLGGCLTEIGAVEEAIKVFHKALSLKNDPIIRYNLIIAYLKKGDKEKACSEIKKIKPPLTLPPQITHLEELCKSLN
ncbi:hypothetical protein F1847_07650 [Thermodesulfobacterium sp. TA1]|uniref:tetratricopeptide repeat protein n=1 Tax=Thermodesulfobacterium sp. TA1 TaxID=2234087 RepID=UPI0012325CE8|nr:hypothetical protein [Thermodesulfobacterium sp. TA1]QER42619.1 hypothetical protein F1847_07650 [Thermodesulfobacterium sp. TA1]